MTQSSDDPRSRGMGWLDSPIIIGEHVKPLLAQGQSEGHWTLDLCAQLSVPRGGLWVSFGCGGGGQEMLIAERGLAERIQAFDRSPEAITEARRISEDRGFPNLSFDVGEPLDVELNDQPRVVLFAMELHRVPDLGPYLSQLSQRLPPGGWILANEYVGPPRFQISTQQARIVEEILAVLPQRLSWNYIHDYRKQVAEVQPEAYWRSEAPREAVSSHLIADTLDEHFHLESIRNYGGSILNPLLSHIVGNFDPQVEGDVTALRLLALLERLLMQEADLPSDFAVFAARKKA